MCYNINIERVVIKIYLKINKDYHVDGEPLNFTLMKRHVVQKNFSGKGESKEGQEVWKVAGYYSSIEAIADKIIKDNIIDSEGELEQVMSAIENAKNDILSALQELGIK